MMPMPVHMRLFPYIIATKLGTRILGDYKISLKNPLVLPKKIYVFWNTGIDDAPEIVKYCVKSWIALNPNWDVTILDQDKANEILERNRFPQDLIIQHYADILRTRILCEHGGVWVDATCLCMRPLDDWISSIFAQSTFFAFSRPHIHAIISNWFLAAVPGDFIVKEWYEAQESFWRQRSSKYPPYLVHHYLFDYLVRNNREFRRRWKEVPRMSAEPPHRLQWALTDENFHRDDAFFEILRCTPVQKLTHRRNIEVDLVDAVFKELRRSNGP